jgi:response regulator RpfG family c-di-GMP phosphodiesterase
MPGIDGFETCRRLKTDAQTKDIPVVFMTALSDTVDKVKGFGIGAVDYVTKPIQHEEVLARVTTHLTIRKLQKRLQKARDELERRVQERTAALSEANAMLKSEIAERKRAEEELRLITEGTASGTGSNFFRPLVRNLASALRVRYAFVAECTDATNTRVRTLAFWKGENFGEDFAYPSRYPLRARYRRRSVLLSGSSPVALS